jgi:hypothetical protein
MSALSLVEDCKDQHLHTKESMRQIHDNVSVSAPACLVGSDLSNGNALDAARMLPLCYNC